MIVYALYDCKQRSGCERITLLSAGCLPSQYRLQQTAPLVRKMMSSMTNSSFLFTEAKDVVVADDFSAEFEKLGAYLDKPCALPAQRTSRGERLRRFCPRNRFVLSDTNFQPSSRGTATWRCNSIGIRNQVGHISVSYCWWGSIQNRISYWSRYA